MPRREDTNRTGSPPDPVASQDPNPEQFDLVRESLRSRDHSPNNSLEASLRPGTDSALIPGKRYRFALNGTLHSLSACGRHLLVRSDDSTFRVLHVTHDDLLSSHNVDLGKIAGQLPHCSWLSADGQQMVAIMGGTRIALFDLSTSSDQSESSAQCALRFDRPAQLVALSGDRTAATLLLEPTETVNHFVTQLGRPHSHDTQYTLVTVTISDTLSVTSTHSLKSTSGHKYTLRDYLRSSAQLLKENPEGGYTYATPANRIRWHLPTPTIADDTMTLPPVLRRTREGLGSDCILAFSKAPESNICALCYRLPNHGFITHFLRDDLQSNECRVKDYGSVNMAARHLASDANGTRFIAHTLDGTLALLQRRGIADWRTTNLSYIGRGTLSYLGFAGPYHVVFNAGNRLHFVPLPDLS